MRVNDTAASQRSAETAQAGRRFGEALRRAREGDSARLGRAEPAAARRPETRRATALRAQGEALARHEEQRAAVAAEPGRPDGSRAVAAAPEIAALVRTLPAAIEAARVRDGAPLSLSFGRSLDVDLRSGAAGIEVVLRPEPRLLRAAEAELPRVVAALRMRGVEVARAEVRGRGGEARRAR